MTIRCDLYGAAQQCVVQSPCTAGCRSTTWEKDLAGASTTVTVGYLERSRLQLTTQVP